MWWQSGKYRKANSVFLTCARSSGGGCCWHYWQTMTSEAVVQRQQCWSVVEWPDPHGPEGWKPSSWKCHRCASPRFRYPSGYHQSCSNNLDHFSTFLRSWLTLEQGGLGSLERKKGGSNSGLVAAKKASKSNRSPKSKLISGLPWPRTCQNQWFGTPVKTENTDFEMWY